MTTEASLVALNEALPSPVGMDRFRPNIVIGGTEPFAEVCNGIYKIKCFEKGLVMTGHGEFHPLICKLVH